MFYSKPELTNSLKIALIFLYSTRMVTGQWSHIIIANFNDVLVVDGN